LQFKIVAKQSLYSYQLLYSVTNTLSWLLSSLKGILSGM